MVALSRSCVKKKIAKTIMCVVNSLHCPAKSARRLLRPASGTSVDPACEDALHEKANDKRSADFADA
jgi:hypothetical protein